MDESNYKRLAIGASLFKAIGETCSIDGCNKEKAARGWCSTHWARWRKHGDPLGGSWDAPKMAPKCEAEGCGRESRSRWDMKISLCPKHYLRMARSGSLDNPFDEPTPDGLCIEIGCAKQVRSRLCQHCEQHYYQIRRTGSAKTTNDMSSYAACLQCGAANAGSSNKYCSDKCANRFKVGVENTKPCAVCSVAFLWSGKGVCCSDSCKAELKRFHGRAWYAKEMASNEVFRLKVRSAEYKRKALKKSAFVEDVDRDSVMLRDKWQCHLCKEKIPKDAVWPNGLFGTLDHVMPLNKGGLHSYANIKAAHLSCNCSKNDRVIGQLGLEFVG